MIPNVETLSSLHISFFIKLLKCSIMVVTLAGYESHITFIYRFGSCVDKEKRQIVNKHYSSHKVEVVELIQGAA